MSGSKTNLEKLFVKHKIRKFDIKIKRLSKEGLKIKNTPILFNNILYDFSNLEYRIAWENTELRRHNIRECYVNVTRLSAQGTTRKLPQKVKTVRSHVLWLPVSTNTVHQS